MGNTRYLFFGERIGPQFCWLTARVGGGWISRVKVSSPGSQAADFSGFAPIPRSIRTHARMRDGKQRARRMWHAYRADGGEPWLLLDDELPEAPPPPRVSTNYRFFVEREAERRFCYHAGKHDGGYASFAKVRLADGEDGIDADTEGFGLVGSTVVVHKTKAEAARRAQRLHDDWKAREEDRKRQAATRLALAAVRDPHDLLKQPMARR